MENRSPAWQVIYDAKEPDNLPLHEPWYSSLSKFYRLVVIGAMRPDKLMELVYAFVSDNVGYKFVERVPFDLGRIFSDSTSDEPIVFLTSGVNETTEKISEFAKLKKTSFKRFSLGASVGIYGLLVLNKNRSSSHS